MGSKTVKSVPAVRAHMFDIYALHAPCAANAPNAPCAPEGYVVVFELVCAVFKQLDQRGNKVARFNVQLEQKQAMEKHQRVHVQFFIL